jgi:undecaprenyl phosphate-alpha-L-ara4FN deformylase
MVQERAWRQLGEIGCEALSYLPPPTRDCRKTLRQGGRRRTIAEAFLPVAYSVLWSPGTGGSRTAPTSLIWFPIAVFSPHTAVGAVREPPLPWGARQTLQVALKIDVDTHEGLKTGVPRMAAMLQREGVTASFFVAMGPDNSGKAIRRIITNRGFLTKMFRTRAVSMYGWRTIASGTLLKARPVAMAFPDLLRDIKARGFEVGVHGYDHVRWQDRIDQLGEQGIEQELQDAFEVYRAVFAEQPRAWAAPGWRANAVSMRMLERAGLLYHSDTRGSTPFRPQVDGQILSTPEVPTTLPTLDEVLGRERIPDAAAMARFYLTRMDAERLNVHTVHAETEGMGQLDGFTALVRALKDAGAEFLRMDAVAARLNPEALPVCPIVRGNFPGRSGWVAVQGEPIPALAQAAS